MNWEFIAAQARQQKPRIHQEISSDGGRAQLRWKFPEKATFYPIIFLLQNVFNLGH
jgi:hypothetical protein